MSRHYILALPSTELGGWRNEASLKIRLANFYNEKPQTGDQVLLALERNGAFDAIVPVIFEIRGGNQKNITLERRQTFSNPVSLDTARAQLSRSLAADVNTPYLNKG